MHYYRLVKYICRPTPLAPCGNLPELQAAFRRVLKSGMANLLDESFDGEALDDSLPGSSAEDIVQMRHDDPRATDFRNYLRIWSAPLYIIRA